MFDGFFFVMGFFFDGFCMGMWLYMGGVMWLYVLCRCICGECE